MHTTTLNLEHRAEGYPKHRVEGFDREREKKDGGKIHSVSPKADVGSEDKVSFVSNYSNTKHYCAYLKTKRTNLGSSGRGTTGLYTFPRWSVHRCLVCAQWNVLEQNKNRKDM